jgi:hypothetical protein
MGNPSSIKSAKKRGWHVVKIRSARVFDRTWLGLLITVDRLTLGPYISEYDGHGGGWLAFQQTGDAAVVAIKFGKIG